MKLEIQLYDGGKHYVIKLVYREITEIYNALWKHGRKMILKNKETYSKQSVK